MADLGNVLSAATEYGNAREAEGRAEERETSAAQVAELNARLIEAGDEINRQVAIIADLRYQLAECQGEDPLPQVCPAGTDREGQQIPDGETEAWCTIQDPDPEPVGNYPTLFGAATTNNQTEFEKLDAAWGPIRIPREYDSGAGIRPVDQYHWFDYVKRNNFDYLVFSADEQKSTASYQQVADGVHDAKIRTMLESVKTKLAGVKGVICLGNEPNTEIAPSQGSSWRAAMEHLIDEFGYNPAPGWMWGVAFSNYNVWGPGSKSVGKGWLPRRDAGPFCVETHFYGRDGYGIPANHLGLLMEEMKAHPKWIWGIGEISAQEDATQTKKGKWFTDVFNYGVDHGISFFQPFDTNVGGSADVATSENTRKAVKALAERCKNNDWS